MKIEQIYRTSDGILHDRYQTAKQHERRIQVRDWLLSHFDKFPQDVIDKLVVTIESDRLELGKVLGLLEEND